jgi:hypothetical protein
VVCGEIWIARSRFREVKTVPGSGNGSNPPDLRPKPDFTSRIKANQPVQPFLKKYSDFPKPQITFMSPAVRSRKEGRWPSSRTLGPDAVDAAALLTNSADADGEVVWS